MRAVVQRVKRASVEIEGRRAASIGKGLLVYVGVEKGDGEADIGFISTKILNLRIFEDEEGNMNLSVMDGPGGILAISQFTLLGDCRKGRRPSFGMAEEPKRAEELYERVVTELKKGTEVATGVFQAHMEVESVNDGPVTMLIDSRRIFLGR